MATRRYNLPSAYERGACSEYRLWTMASFLQMGGSNRIFQAVAKSFFFQGRDNSGEILFHQLETKNKIWFY